MTAKRRIVNLFKVGQHFIITTLFMALLIKVINTVTDCRDKGGN